MIQKPGSLKITHPAHLPQFANIGIGAVAGWGKTHLLGTVGKGNKVLILDTEGGTSTYSSPAFKAAEDATDKIDVIRFDDVSSCQELTLRVEQAFDYLIKTKNSDGYTLVAVDSLTEFQERFLSMHQAPDKRQSYGALRDDLYTIVNKARNVPVHTIFTARLKATQDEVLNREIVRFEVSPGVYSVISGLYDVIAYGDMKRTGIGNNARVSRILDSNPTLRTPGKDRMGVGEMTDPTFKKILTKIYGGK